MRGAACFPARVRLFGNPFEHIQHFHSSPELFRLAPRHGPAFHPLRARCTGLRSGGWPQRASPGSPIPCGPGLRPSGAPGCPQ
eukprot:11202365-Alexandrium_andersonii.AAC.1